MKGFWVRGGLLGLPIGSACGCRRRRCGCRRRRGREGCRRRVLVGGVCGCMYVAVGLSLSLYLLLMLW